MAFEAGTRLHKPKYIMIGAISSHFRKASSIPENKQVLLFGVMLEKLKKQIRLPMLDFSYCVLDYSQFAPIFPP